MSRRDLRMLALVASAVTCALAVGGAQARSTDSPVVRHTFGVPGNFATSTTTAGALQVSLGTQGPCNPFVSITVELQVDGGPTQTYAVRPGGSIGPYLAPAKRGARTVDLRTRVNPACTSPDPILGNLSLVSSEDELTGAKLSFVERTNALKQSLRPTAVNLAARRDSVEAALEAAGQRTYRALERKHAITDMQIRAAGAHRVVARRLASLHRAQPLRIDIGRDETAAIRSIGTHLSELERRAVAAARAGGQHRAFDARIKHLRAQLLVLETRLDAKRPRGLADQWLAVRKELNRLAARNHDLRVAEAQAERERTSAEDLARGTLQARASLDREAFGLWTRLTTLDVDVRDLRVLAGGRLAFHLQGQRAQYEHVRELQVSIAEAEQALAEAELIRKIFAQLFYNAQKTVIAAEAKLAEAIWDAARLRALVDGLFHAWDLTDAFIKGGPIALLGSGLQKIIEQKISEQMRPPGTVEPGSIEDQINRRYKAGLAESITGERIGYLAGERLAKETVVKAGRDSVGRALADSLFTRLDAKVTPGVPTVSRGIALPTLADIKKWRNARRTFGHLDQQIDKLQVGFKKKGFFGNLAKNAVKDIAKVALKRVADEVEEQAWVGFFEADVVARASYPAYAAAKDHEWMVYDAHQRLLERKQQLLEAGWDMRGYTTSVTGSFAPDAELEVQVRAVGLGPTDTPLAVYIGKTSVPFVSRSGETLVYRTSASRLEAGAQSTVTIE